VVLAPGAALDPAVSSGTITLTPPAAGGMAEARVAFSFAHDFPTDGSITVEFPAGYGGYGSADGITNISDVRINDAPAGFATMISNEGGVITLATRGVAVNTKPHTLNPQP